MFPTFKFERSADRLAGCNPPCVRRVVKVVTFLSAILLAFLKGKLRSNIGSPLRASAPRQVVKSGLGRMNGCFGSADYPAVLLRMRHRVNNKPVELSYPSRVARPSFDKGGLVLVQGDGCPLIAG